MAQVPRPSALSLVHRGLVLLGLIARGVGLYLRVLLDRRGWWRSPRGRLEERQQRFARAFVTVASRFRGGLIKVGQVASLRLDVLPEEITAELARLQDRVEPHPFAEVAAQIETALGAPLERHFAAFEPLPIAAASLGQVHAARARDGRALAVKVLYPGIERSVAVDLAMVKLALWLFDFAAVGDLMQVYRELRETIRGEMDYLREGAAAEEIAGNLAADPDLARRVRIPTIAWDLTRRRVLSMEFLEGIKINDPSAASGAGRGPLVLWASRAFLHMMFRDGFFHCDPHPGNLMVCPDGRIGIVDFGMTQRMSPGLLDAIRDNVVATVARDREAYATSLVRAGVVDPADLPVVRELADMAFDPAYYNLTPQEMANLDFAEYFGRMRGHLKRLRSFRLPEGIVMWSRAISLLYGLMVELAPGLRPLDVIGPYIVEMFQSVPEKRPLRDASEVR